METIIKEILYRNGDKFSIYPFSDSHLGAKESAEQTLSHTIQECAALGRFGLAVGVGDWLDCIVKNDKRFRMNGLAGWVEPSNIIDSQRRHCTDIFRPLVEAGQLIAIGSGNHEEAIHNHHDDDITRNICRDLHTPYAGYTAFIILKFRQHCFWRYPYPQDSFLARCGCGTIRWRTLEPPYQSGQRHRSRHLSHGSSARYDGAYPRPAES